MPLQLALIVIFFRLDDMQCKSPHFIWLGKILVIIGECYSYETHFKRLSYFSTVGLDMWSFKWCD